ncbi:hypothetical protein N6L26_08450 [Qipengyuania sp. SS22]|uniref:hypothetical protein n=1 Tax=Qipengyuania sp. SS22 TaxID=2979461 RepID=UPI0021E5DD28|nr:hypothetical protein [Qipengyuania sp. SS22]UYH56275.1 hypothetical protein N6L26_08450 [Qipengyuania sp. SS22]
MRFTSRFDPRAGAADLWEYIREPRPYRWPILAVSIAIPLAGVAMLAQESHFRPPDAPKVNFISTFAEGRSDEEIRQSNIVNQERKEAREAEREELRARKVEAYKALGRATGLDVDEMERQAQIESAREQAIAEARRRERYQAGPAVDLSGD